MLAPFAPHIAEELWRRLGGKQSISGEAWPAWDDEAAREEEVELVIQVNGKVRGKSMVRAGLSDDALRKIALEDPKVRSFTEGKEIRKVIVVKGRLVNIVVGK